MEITKKVSDSVVDMVQLVLPNDVNLLNNLKMCIRDRFATWFPNFTKKCKTLFVVVGVILMVPVVIKAVNTFKEVFKYKWW